MSFKQIVILITLFILGVISFILTMHFVNENRSSLQRYEDCKNTELYRGVAPNYNETIKICQPLLNN
jgi:hypothetical protein